MPVLHALILTTETNTGTRRRQTKQAPLLVYINGVKDLLSGALINIDMSTKH